MSKKKISSRVKVAAVVPDRLPAKPAPSVFVEPATVVQQPAPRPVGRPRKDPKTKAQQVSVTLWPNELEAFEALRAAVNADLPAEVSRSDFARLAFKLLLALDPAGIRKRLVGLRK